MNAPDTDLRLNELLAAHLDTLIRGDRLAARPLAASAPAELRDLMNLAARLDETFAPVLPSAAFMTRLRAEFVQDQTSGAFMLRWRKLPPRYQAVAKFGGATLTVGLMLLAARRALGLASNTRARQQPVSDPVLSG